MGEEQPAPKTYRPISTDTSPPPSEGEPAVTEAQSMEQSNKQTSSRQSSPLILAGFLVVIALIIAGLFLPPISLGKRLGLSSDEGQTVSEAVVDSTAPGSADTQLAEGRLTPLSLADFSADDTWAAAAMVIPENLVPVGPIYVATAAGRSVGDRVTLSIPSDAAATETLDLYGWNGTAWLFVPSELAAGMVESRGDTASVAALAIMQTTPSNAPVVAAELLPTEVLPTELLPLISEISAGTLTLAENGGLQGEAVSVPTGPYDVLLRVTNTGAIIDQASLATLLATAEAQEDHINALVGYVLTGGYAGINLDYQGVAPESIGAYTGFVASLASALHGQDRRLAVTLATPVKTSTGWDPGGQDWAALGELADTIYLQLPLDPSVYGDRGDAEVLLHSAVRQISRDKLIPLLSASAVDRIGESFLEISNDQALSNFGELRFVDGSAEVEPGAAVEVALSGTAQPLEWDGASLTYRYAYDVSGQIHNVWIGSEAALGYRLRLANRYHVRGIAVRGLGNLANSSGFAATLSSYVNSAEAPQPVGAAIVWTVRTADGSVLASSSGDALSFLWEGTEEAGTYSVNADFALGETITTLGSLDVAVASVEQPELVVDVESGDEEEVAEGGGTSSVATPPAAAGPQPTPPPADTSGADAVVNTGANVRVGPGLGYGTIAGGLQAGSKVKVLGRNADASWIHILMPDGQTKGWIFATLLTINSSINVATLEVIEVEPPTVAETPGGGGSAPPPVSAPPVTNTGFQLGGQTHSFANPSLMSYAGMTWVKFQHKWSVGDSPDVVAGRIQQAHANGFKVLLSIPGTDHSSIDFNAYASFLGGVAALGPDAIEVWNEMNIDREWPAGQISPSSYVNNMLAPSYNAIKAARSSVMVISGAPAPTGFFGGCGGGGCDDNLYVAGMAGAGAANYMDCIGIHYNEGIISPNQTSGDPRNPSNHYTRYFWGMVNAYWNAFGGSRPLCFTELGYLSGADYGGLPGGFAWAGNTSVSQHAQWLAEAASLSASSGKVRMMIVFNVDFTTYGVDPQAGYAMIRRDGSCPACETLHQVMGNR